MTCGPPLNLFLFVPLEAIRYEDRTYRDLYSIARERNLEGAKRKVGLTKEVLVELLLASDGQQTAAGGEQDQSASSGKKLADLLKPGKSVSTASFLTPGGKGEDITNQFLDVKSAEKPSTARAPTWRKIPLTASFPV